METLEEQRLDALRANPEFNASAERLLQARDARAAVGPAPVMEGVSKGPYVTSTQGWTDLAVKRILKEAAEGGYDKIVWTPGAEQAKRYDLSQHVDSLQYVPKSGKVYAYKDKKMVFNKAAKPEELERVVGKDVAKKLLASVEHSGQGKKRQILTIKLNNCFEIYR